MNELMKGSIILEPKIGKVEDYEIIIFNELAEKLFASSDVSCFVDNTKIVRDCFQFMIYKIMKYCKEYDVDHEITYGDTDVIHIRLPDKNIDESIIIGNNIVYYINNMKYYNGELSVVLKHIFNSTLYEANKKYETNIVWENGFKLSEPRVMKVGV